jgi:hypothetical protein
MKSEWKLKKEKNLVFQNKKDEVVNERLENKQNMMEKKRNLNDVDGLFNQDEKNSKMEM